MTVEFHDVALPDSPLGERSAAVLGIYDGTPGGVAVVRYVGGDPVFTFFWVEPEHRGGAWDLWAQEMTRRWPVLYAGGWMPPVATLLCARNGWLTHPSQIDRVPPVWDDAVEAEAAESGRRMLAEAAGVWSQ